MPKIQKMLSALTLIVLAQKLFTQVNTLSNVSILIYSMLIGRTLKYFVRN